MAKTATHKIVPCTGMERTISEVKITLRGKVVHRCSADEAPEWIAQQAEH